MFLSHLHGFGHPSHRATKPLINTRYVWHGMNIDIAEWCRSCKGCRTAKISCHNRPVFGKFAEPTERFDHVHIDIVGPLPYSDGFRYLLTCVTTASHVGRKAYRYWIFKPKHRRCLFQWSDSTFWDPRHYRHG